MPGFAAAATNIYLYNSRAMPQTAQLSTGSAVILRGKLFSDCFEQSGREPSRRYLVHTQIRVCGDFAHFANKVVNIL